MHFIEEVFGLAPDGGNGLTELAILLVCLIALGGLVYLRRARKSRSPK